MNLKETKKPGNSAAFLEVEYKHDKPVTSLDVIYVTEQLSKNTIKKLSCNKTLKHSKLRVSRIREKTSHFNGR